MAAWGYFPHVGLGLARSRDKTLFPLDPDAPAVVHLFLGGLALQADEEKRVRDVVERSQAQLHEALAQEFTAATGESADEVPFEFLIAGLHSSASELEASQARERIAKARAAGESIAAPEVATPLDKAYGLIYAFGDTFERALAEELGAARARSLREQRGGWDGERLAETGCP